MKILFTIRDLHPGGACKLLVNVMPALQEKGIETYLIYYNDNHALLNDFKSSGIYPSFIPYRGKTDLFSSTWSTYQLIKNKQIDLVHTNLFLDRTIASIAAWIAGIPCISYIHHAESQQQIRYGSIVQKLIRKASQFLFSRLLHTNVAVSEAAAKRWIEQPYNRVEKVRVIHSGISRPGMEEGLEESVSTWMLNKDKILVTACRLDEIKGLDRLLRIFRKVVDVMPKTGLIILGEGRSESKLENLINELDLKDQVLMLGYKENVYDYYQIADFYVNSSRSEAMPISIIEAMQIGLPTLGSKVGGIPEIIEDEKNGYLLDFDDEETTTNRIIKALKMPDDEYQKMRKQSREMFTSRFTIERYVDQLLAFYRKILG